MSRKPLAFSTAMTAFTLVAFVCPAATASAAPPVKKPAPAQPGVKGTPQLPGDVGKIGVTYTLSGNGDPYNLTIKRIFYVASRMTLSGKVIYPDADKKFLVIDYTVQNPNSGSDLGVHWDRFKLTAVDSLNQNYDQQGDAENTTNLQNLDIDLKPGQKVEARQYLIVPAGTQVPKLMLDWGAGKVMRFDLHEGVEPVEAILHDPADKTGTIALTTISNAQVGTTYPSSAFDVTVEKIELTDASLGGNAPDDGKRYLVATIRAKNMTKEDQDFNAGNGFGAFVMDSDGDKIDWTNTYLKASADEQADTNTSTGVEKRFRIYFSVPKSASLKTMTLSQGESYRKLVYDISSVK